jgi:hypothetical protein
MTVVNTDSLAETLDAANDALFHRRRLAESNREELARWIAQTSGKPGSYAGMFAPTDIDLRNGVRVYTGEMIRSRAGISHVLGEEACRALILLGVGDSMIGEALERATAGMLHLLRHNEDTRQVHGLFCCGLCSVAYWRHVIVGGLDRNEERLSAGMEALRAHRTDDGRWRRFPFYYTLLALSEMNLESALDEMRYAAPLLERYVKRKVMGGGFPERRRAISERILARC